MFMDSGTIFVVYCDGRGIEPSVSTVEIKKAYRKAALRHHPDKVSYICCYYILLLVVEA